MEEYRGRGGFAKIFFLLILILALLVGGLVWLDFLGLIHIKDRLAPLTSLFGVQSSSTALSSSAIPMDQDRLAKERELLTLEEQALQNISEELVLREAALQQKENSLLEKERTLNEKENSLSEALSQYDNKKVNLEQTARYMVGMPPEDAVAIMEEYEVKDLVDLLRTTEKISQEEGESSLVAFWLSLMTDRARTAEIQRLLVEKPALNFNELRGM